MGTKAISTQTLTRQLVDKVRASIMESNLEKGTVFMTVDQLAEQHGVSRTIAREAASQLQALGFLRGKQRLGLVVDRPNVHELMKQWLPMYSRSMGHENIQALAQLRYVLEVGSIGFAVANATSEQLDLLSALAADFEKVTAENGQTEEADRIEIEFHSLILKMTGNPLISGMHSVLSDYFQEAVRSNPNWQSVSPDAIWEHKAIAKAIAQRDIELARNLLRHHLDNSLSELTGC
jgi:DNA-binding FadR family transcriptional regulator